MKVVIQHSQTKREIKGAFSLCASRDDLRSLARQILGHLEESGFTYGWIEILANEPAGVLANTSPRGWDA